jgi:hypothetical protein
MKCVHSDSSYQDRRGLWSPSTRRRGEPMSQLSEGQAILVILMTSLGLWLVIWGIFMAAEYVLT